MKLTGFADEAAKDLATQIKATKELGWEYISARGINGKNIHDLPEYEFEQCLGQLEEAGVKIAEFGSLVGTWAKSIDTDFSITLAEVERCIPRMKRLGTEVVRIMSYGQNPWNTDQKSNERFRRLAEISKIFTDAGLIPAHENCMNWGGFSADHTLKLIEKIPGLKLIFDTGNPVFQRDRSSIQPDGSFPWQDALDFFHKVKEHTIHIHIKDCINPVRDDVEPKYTFPGEGQAYVKEIITELKQDNYQGFIAIEPHVATVFHAKEEDVNWQQCYDSYIQYGREMEHIIASS